MFFEQNSFIITLSFSLFLIIFLAIYFQKEYALCYRKSIKFENTEGWWYGGYYTDIPRTEIPSLNLSDDKTAALYLKNIYDSYRWYRD